MIDCVTTFIRHCFKYVYGIRTAQLGIAVSIALVFVKAFSGYVGHSYALIADATESGRHQKSEKRQLFPVLATVVTDFSYCSGKRPDVKNFSRTRKWLVVLLSFFLMVGLALPVVSFWVRNKVRRELDGVLKSLAGHYRSLHVSLLPAVIEVEQLSLRMPLLERKDSVQAVIAHLRLSGISYYALLRNSELAIDRVDVQRCTVDFDPDMLEKGAPEPQLNMPSFLRSILVKNLTVRDLHARTLPDARRLFDANITARQFRVNWKASRVYISSAAHRAEVWHLFYGPNPGHINLYAGHLIFSSGPPFFQSDSCSIYYAQQPGFIVARAFIDQLKCVGQVKQGPASFLVEQLTARRVSLQTRGRLPSWDSVRSQLARALPGIHVCLRVRQFSAEELTLHGLLNGQKLELHSAAKLTDLNVEMGGHRVNRLSGNLHMNINSANYITRDGRYTVLLHGGALDSRMKLLELDALQMVPRYGKFQFGPSLGHQVDWIKASVHNIRLTGIAFGALLHGRLVADRLYVGNSTIDVFRDRRLPRLQYAQPLPVSQLQSLPVAIIVGSLQMGNTSIRYDEQPKSGGPAGTLRVHLNRITIYPLLNHVTKEDAAFLTMEMEGSIMDKGVVYARMELPLKGSTYHVTGAIRMLDLTALNSGAENLGNLRIRSGLLDSLGFDFRFDKLQAYGKIAGVYHRLVLQQLKPGANGEKKVAFFRSFALRHLIIPLNKDRSLPEKKRTGMIHYTRDPSRNLSYYLMQSILTGIKNSFKLGFLLPK